MITFMNAEEMRAYFEGKRIVYQGARITNPYNVQVEPNDCGSVLRVEDDGQVIVAFDRGVVIPLTIEGDVFMAM